MSAPNCQAPDILAMRAALAGLEARITVADRDAQGGAPADVAEAVANAHTLRQAAAQARATLARAVTAYTREVQLITVACRDLKIEPETRRARILAMTGGRTDSRAAMTGTERARLLAEFRREGWSPERHAAGRVRVRPGEDRAALAAKLIALLADAGRPSSYADSIAKRRFAVDRWEWLSYASLSKLVAMLAIDQTRRAQRAEATP